MKKQIVNLSVVFLIITVISLFSGYALARDQILVGGATIGTTPYVYALGFSTLANKYFPKYKFMVQATGGTVENLKLVNQKEIEIVAVTPGVLTAAKEGTKWFKDLKDSRKERYDSVRGIFVYVGAIMHFIVKDGSPIHSLYDVKGKRVALGAPGSSAGLITTSIIEAYGLKKNIDYKAVELDASASSEAWQDNMVDLWCQYSEVPGGLVSNATGLNKFRLIPLEDEKAIKILRENKTLSLEEGTFLTSIESAAYPTMMNKKSVVQLATLGVFVAHKDVSEDIVYCFTKANFDHLDELYKNIPSAVNSVNLKEALNGMIVPLHPGAAKYFGEKGMVK